MNWMTLGLAVALWTAAGPAGAVDCPTGPEGNRCKAENGDPRAMYLIGREAYDEARTTGDFSEAYMWALRSKEADFLGGRMLLKMVYLQAGEGLHHDYVEAHRWLSEAIADGDEYLVPWERRLEAKMTPEQIAKAHRLEAE